MALTVIVRSGDSETAPEITFDAPRIIIGRGDGCEVRLPDPSVSHRHASVRQRGSDYLLFDEDSTNGTFVGTLRLTSGAPRVVRSGDLVRVGRVWLELHIHPAPPTADAGGVTRDIALGLVADALAAQGEAATPKVRVAKGRDAGRELDLTEPGRGYVVGRGSADLALDDPDASRRHVEITRSGGRLLVRDLGSKNGTRLAGEALEPDVSTRWIAGADLVIGSDHLTWEDPVAEALAELERSADERLHPGEEIAPPVGATPLGDREIDDTEPDPLAGAAAGHDSVAPVAERPVRAAAAAKPKRAPRPGWGMTDALVALLALVVLGLSIAGLVWLFRSG